MCKCSVSAIWLLESGRAILSRALSVKETDGGKIYQDKRCCPELDSSCLLIECMSDCTVNLIKFTGLAGRINNQKTVSLAYGSMTDEFVITNVNNSPPVNVSHSALSKHPPHVDNKSRSDLYSAEPDSKVFASHLTLQLMSLCLY